MVVVSTLVAMNSVPVLMMPTGTHPMATLVRMLFA
jgi:hypothetical protein